jgi:hypothetical protein
MELRLRKLILLFFLLIFSVAIFPKEYLHDLFCSHDEAKEIYYSESYQKTHHHCPFFKFEISSFIYDYKAPPDNHPELLSIVNFQIHKTFFSRALQSYNLRAPPSIF